MESKKETVDALIVPDEGPKKPSKMFRDLKEGDKPLAPLPPDNMSDISYPQFMEPRCAICTSPFRDLVEHVYLDSGRKNQSVIRFFLQYFDAQMNWMQINTHMEQHCDFKKISTSGLRITSKGKNSLLLGFFVNIILP